MRIEVVARGRSRGLFVENREFLAFEAADGDGRFATVHDGHVDVHQHHEVLIHVPLIQLYPRCPVLRKVDGDAYLLAHPLRDSAVGGIVFTHHHAVLDQCALATA